MMGNKLLGSHVNTSTLFWGFKLKETEGIGNAPIYKQMPLFRKYIAIDMLKRCFFPNIQKEKYVFTNISEIEINRHINKENTWKNTATMKYCVATSSSTFATAQRIIIFHPGHLFPSEIEIP